MNLQAARQTIRSALPLLVVVVVLGIAGYRLRFAPVQARAAQATTEIVTTEILGTGTLESRVRASVSPKIQGRIASIQVDQNDFIQAGQLLVTLEDAELKELVEVAAANLGATEASVARAKADRERLIAIEKQARLDHKRVADLLANKVAAQSDLDKSVERLEIAEADLKRSEFATFEAERQSIAAQRNLQYQRERLKDAQIRSPFNGLVVRRNRESGDVVVPGSSILDIISTNELWISAWVDETVLSQLHTGAPTRVVFRSEPKRTYQSEVIRIGRETDRETRELLVDVRVKQLPANWAVGQRAEIYIQGQAASPVLAVPSEAIMWRNGKPGLFVRNKSRAVWKEVEIGARGQGRTEIISGISADDSILLETKPGTLREGRRVRVL
jgi:HlyD family secretion protein